MNSPKTKDLDTSRNPFLSDDWVKRIEAKFAGVDDRIAYESLPPDHQQFLSELQAGFDRIPAMERERLEKRVAQFVAGEMSWAEFDSYPPALLYQIATVGQSFIEINRLDDAETLFKGLAILDHKNYYYHGVLGPIYTNKKQFIYSIY